MAEEFDRTIELMVSGMTCGNCVKHVSDEIKEIDTVSKVSVVLKPEGKSSVVVVTDEDIADRVLREAVAEAGNYEVHEIVR